MTPRSSGAPRGGGTALVVLAAGLATRYGGVKPLAPVGVAGEAVVDVLASDALAAGFSRIVLVVGPATGPAIRYHVERTWPASVDVRFATQERPRGTADAVLAAAVHLERGAPFGVANSDDLYGEAGLGLLAGHLAGREPGNALVSYRLRSSLVGNEPVTRGICRLSAGGALVAIDERRQVAPAGNGRFVSADGREPAEIDGDAPVSMNLWGFVPETLGVLRAAVRASKGDEEVLLPEVVANMVARPHDGATRGTPSVHVLSARGRCIGVTHPGDVRLVAAALAAEVARGDRPGQLWTVLAGPAEAPTPASSARAETSARPAAGAAGASR